MKALKEFFALPFMTIGVTVTMLATLLILVGAFLLGIGQGIRK